MSDKRKRSGISSDRAHRLQATLRARLSDIVANGRCFYDTFDHISDVVRERIYNSPEWKRAPSHVHSYIQGCWDTVRDNLWRDAGWMMWCDERLMTREEIDALTEGEILDMYRAYVERCGKPEDGSHRIPPTLEEFRRNNGRQVVNGREIHVGSFLPSDYKSPWARVNGDLSRHVWVDRKTGKPLPDKPFYFHQDKESTHTLVSSRY